MSGSLIELVVPGQPIPWARARRKGKQYFTDPQVKAHANAIRRAWLAAGRPRVAAGVPVVMTALFYLERPAGHFRTGRYGHLLRDDAPAHHLVKPDADNFVKLVADALNTLMYPDDSQVVGYSPAMKYWCDPGEPPRTVLRAWIPHPRLSI